MQTVRETAADTSADAAGHTLRRLREAPLRTDPFPHCVIPEILPAALYERALAHWPVTEEMRLAQQELPLRYQTPLDDRWLAGRPEESSAVWREVRDALFNTGVVEHMAERFPSVRGKMSWNGGAPPVLHARIIEDHAGHAMLPHTDIEVTMFSMLVYMPADDRGPHLGTALYRPRDGSFRGRGMDRYPREDFELAGQAPFLPNHLLTYAPSDHSFHGVEPVEPPCVRRLLVLFAMVDTRSGPAAARPS
ncbi:hypothetical protein [Azospirillum doebereinerae]